MGLPQGSILFVTIFNVKKKKITESISTGTDCTLYRNDFVAYYRSKRINTIERNRRLRLNKINKLPTDNDKTKFIHFCQLRKMHYGSTLQLNNSTIPVVNQYKYNRIIFDRKLTFIPINYLPSKCNKPLQLLRAIAHTYGEHTNNYY